MAYQRQYLQQTQSRTYSAGSPGTPGTPETSTTTWVPVRVSAPNFISQLSIARSLGYQFSRSSPTGFLAPQTTITPGTPGTPATPGTEQTSRLRRGEMVGGDLRLMLSQGKRSLRIEPTELGQIPGRDLPPPGASNYDPFTASEAESLAGLRRRRGPQVDLSINSANASSGLNTL